MSPISTNITVMEALCSWVLIQLLPFLWAGSLLAWELPSNAFDLSETTSSRAEDKRWAYKWSLRGRDNENKIDKNNHTSAPFCFCGCIDQICAAPHAIYPLLTFTILEISSKKLLLGTIIQPGTRFIVICWHRIQWHKMLKTIELRTVIITFDSTISYGWVLRSALWSTI